METIRLGKGHRETLVQADNPSAAVEHAETERGDQQGWKLLPGGQPFSPSGITPLSPALHTQSTQSAPHHEVPHSKSAYRPLCGRLDSGREGKGGVEDWKREEDIE
jgi:hypothetical protein